MEWIQVLTIIVGVIFGVSGVAWWINSITNKRIDDTNQKITDATNNTNQKITDAINNTNKRFDDMKELFTAKLEPLQKQVEKHDVILKELQYEVSNHIPTQIRELREKEDRDFKELKANQEKMQKDIEKVLTLIEKTHKPS